jgi:predicted transcriptional regulator
MSTENTTELMNVESLQMKVENQKNMVKQLSNENEELYHQFNHLMIRNNKLLKRIDDLQGIIDDLHIRIEELQLINGNILKLNDKFRPGNDYATDGLLKSNDDSEKINTDLKSNEEFENVLGHWKMYPEQDAKNEPNLRKQARMLVHLYKDKSLRASELFAKTEVGGVTGARYVAALKKLGLITYKGARKKGKYEMTKKGVDFIESSMHAPWPIGESLSDNSFSDSNEYSNFPAIEQPGIPVKEEVKDMLSSHFNHADL